MSANDNKHHGLTSFIYSDIVVDACCSNYHYVQVIVTQSTGVVGDGNAGGGAPGGMFTFFRSLSSNQYY